MKAIEQRLPREFDKSFIVFIEKGKFFPCPWHYHPEYELVLVTKSKGRRMVGDHIGYFEEGDLVFIGSMVPHLWVNDSEYYQSDHAEMAEAIVIQFEEIFIGERFLEIPEMHPVKTFLNLSNRGMVIKGEARRKITALMKEMVHMNGIQRLAGLFNIFDVLASNTEFDLLASPGYQKASQFDGRDRFSIITEYIVRNSHHNITLPEVAAQANMAVTTFCNFFKEHHRVTFVEYLNRVRVGHACQLLSSTNKIVSEIAYECGFNNLANFNRQFKKIKAMPPVEYRKSIRE